MLLDFKKLFEPYTKDRCTIELLVRWLIGEGIDRDVINHAMTETFLEIKNGRSFLGKCDCGCESPNIHTYLSHSILRRCRKFQGQIEESKRLALQENLNTQILVHIQEQNKEYEEAQPDREIGLGKWEAELMAREERLKAEHRQSRTRVPRWSFSSRGR